MPQPDLEIFVPLRTSAEYSSSLRPSLALFWPSAPIVALVDAELNATAFAASLHVDAAIRRVHYSDVGSSCSGPRQCNNPCCGHDRQQLYFFHIDQMSSARLVGYTDADTLFTTPVTGGDLFSSDGRPRILARVGDAINDWWAAMPRAIELALGSETFSAAHSPYMMCMCYFPVVVHAEHVAALRRHIEARHQMPMLDVILMLKRQVGTHYSQFDIACNFLWRHYRDQYVWHMQRTDNPRHTMPSSNLSVTHFAQSPHAVHEPWVRVALHSGYLTNEVVAGHLGLRRKRGVKASDSPQWVAVAEGYCRAAINNDLPLPEWCVRRSQPISFCPSGGNDGVRCRSTYIKLWRDGNLSAWHTKTVHWALFTFEPFLSSEDWTKTATHESVLAAQRAHYQRVREAREFVVDGEASALPFAALRKGQGQGDGNDGLSA